MATTTRTGPRRLVLRDIARKAAPKPVGSTLLAAATPLPAGSLSMSSWSDPGLIEGQSYTVTIDQTVNYVDPTSKAGVTQPVTQAPNDLHRTQTFKVVGNRYALDSSMVHSVYPPQGHEDYLNTLPHLLYSNDQVPWIFSVGTPPKPWCALVLFTGDELTLDDADLKAIITKVSAPITGVGAITRDSVSQATIMTDGQLGTLLTSQIPKDGYLQPETHTTAQPASAVFMPLATYTNMFSTPDRYVNMTHVRSFNASSLSNFSASESGTMAVSVCPRIYPGAVSAPTKVYAHLVALPAGGTPPVPLKVSDTRSLCALPSLYSWSWMALPAPSFNLDNDLHDLGTTVQPLRNLDAYINQVGQTPAEAWIRRRMLAGYSLGGWSTSTGEATTCIYRTMLSPIDQPRPALPSSDNGLDLAIIDLEQTVYDLTFPLAWELGRMTAMADRSLSAAIMRIRGAAHAGTLKACKVMVDSTTNNVHRSATELLQGLLTAAPKLKTMTVLTQPAPVSFQRWIRTPVVYGGTRAQLAFANSAIQTAYQSQMPTTAKALSAAIDSGGRAPRSVGTPVDRPVYNGSNTPASTDYAMILNWYFDRMYLYGLPWVNLIGDPTYIPRESIRTFYVDPTWCDVFLDGVLTVGEHFTAVDEARQQIKQCIKHCLTVPAVNGHVPQIPVWGFFLRSEICQKFPDLQVTAPRAANQVGLHGADVLRCDLVDDDLLLVLFDRKPGSNAFPQGITIQPPEHQLKFSLGDIDDWTFSDGGVIKMPNLALSAVTAPGNPVMVPPDAARITTALPLDPATGFIQPESLARVIKEKFSKVPQIGTSGYDGLAALIGSQLVAKNPSLKLNDDNSLGIASMRMGKATVVALPATPLSSRANKASAKAEQGSKQGLLAMAAPARTTSVEDKTMINASTSLSDAQRNVKLAQETVAVQKTQVRALNAQIATLDATPDAGTGMATLKQQLETTSAALATAQISLETHQVEVAVSQSKLASIQSRSSPAKASAPTAGARTATIVAPPAPPVITALSSTQSWEMSQQVILFNSYRAWSDAQNAAIVSTLNVQTAQNNYDRANFVEKTKYLVPLNEAKQADFNTQAALVVATGTRASVLQTNLLFFLEMMANNDCTEQAFVSKYLVDGVAKMDSVMDWTPVYYDSDAGPLYMVQLYNLRTQLTFPGRPAHTIGGNYTDPEYRHLYAVLPLSQGVKSDVVVSIRSTGWYRQTQTKGIDMTIPVGTLAVLAPLQRAGLPTPGALALGSGSRLDFPHLPRNKYSAVVVPKIRMLNDSVHWVPRISYVPASSNESEPNGSLKINISLAAGVFDSDQGVTMDAFPDISFVIQDVVVNYNTASTNAQLTVNWKENISFWQGPTDWRKGWAGSTNHDVLVPVFAVDTQAGMAIRPPIRFLPTV